MYWQTAEHLHESTAQPLSPSDEAETDTFCMPLCVITLARMSSAELDGVELTLTSSGSGKTHQLRPYVNDRDPRSSLATVADWQFALSQRCSSSSTSTEGAGGPAGNGVGGESISPLRMQEGEGQSGDVEAGGQRPPMANTERETEQSDVFSEDELRITDSMTFRSFPNHNHSPLAPGESSSPPMASASSRRGFSSVDTVAAHHSRTFSGGEDLAPSVCSHTQLRTSDRSTRATFWESTSRETTPTLTSSVSLFGSKESFKRQSFDNGLPQHQRNDTATSSEVELGLHGASGLSESIVSTSAGIADARSFVDMEPVPRELLGVMKIIGVFNDAPVELRPETTTPALCGACGAGYMWSMRVFMSAMYVWLLSLPSFLFSAGFIEMPCTYSLAGYVLPVRRCVCGIRETEETRTCCSAMCSSERVRACDADEL